MGCCQSKASVQIQDPKYKTEKNPPAETPKIVPNNTPFQLNLNIPSDASAMREADEYKKNMGEMSNMMKIMMDQMKEQNTLIENLKKEKQENLRKEREENLRRERQERVSKEKERQENIKKEKQREENLKKEVFNNLKREMQQKIKKEMQQNIKNEMQAKMKKEMQNRPIVPPKKTPAQEFYQSLEYIGRETLQKYQILCDKCFIKCQRFISIMPGLRICSTCEGYGVTDALINHASCHRCRVSQQFLNILDICKRCYGKGAKLR